MCVFKMLVVSNKCMLTCRIIRSFSALKMDGKPLYEYARKGIPLPRPIVARPVTVHELSLLSFTPGGDHTYEFPKEELDSASKLELEKIAKMVAAGGTVVPDVDEPTPEDAPAPSVPTSKYIPILLLSQPSAPQLIHPAPKVARRSLSSR